MESREIENIKENGTMLRDDPNALQALQAYVLDVYMKYGLHRGMNETQFSEEVRGTAMMLQKDLLADRKYKFLRTQEVGYCFCNGIKGRLSKTRDSYVNYSTLIGWIEAYVDHPEYREAVHRITNKPLPASMQLQAPSYDDEARRRFVQSAFKDYVEYKSKTSEEALERRAQVRTIGEVLRFPISCLDYGGLKMEWLVRHKYAREGEKLTDVFDRMLAQRAGKN